MDSGGKRWSVDMSWRWKEAGNGPRWTKSSGPQRCFLDADWRSLLDLSFDLCCQDLLSGSKRCFWVSPSSMCCAANKGPGRSRLGEAVCNTLQSRRK
ncbi:hypothetical protein GDO78_018501 [Eleutherodactylus coqui]|uniref:Uncharacterized protein n=1 Tax=Eleutherodactylus coqui TaxID=57060 RepID=A0A8J6ECL2_ELECQ|nr:hypothetical protein GDO78_018501 [Eleutherodactylus coqui]